MYLDSSINLFFPKKDFGVFLMGREDQVYIISFLGLHYIASKLALLGLHGVSSMSTI